MHEIPLSDVPTSMEDSYTLPGTTLPDDVTVPEIPVLPYLRLGLDSYESVISKYGSNFNADNPWKALEGAPVDPERLRTLVETIAFLYDKRHLKEAMHIHSKSKGQFECKTCQSFVIVFGQNKNGGKHAPFTLKGEPLSHYQTRSETSVVPNCQVLENMSQFSDYVYSPLYSGKEVIGRKVREHLTFFSSPL
jgi:hypothetical protein